MSEAATSRKSSVNSVERGGLTYRGQVASRLLAALLGGYLLANASAILLARLLPHLAMSRADSVLVAVLFSFAIYVCAVLWAFAVRSAARAWLGLIAATLVCAGLAWLLGGGEWMLDAGSGGGA